MIPSGAPARPKRALFSSNAEGDINSWVMKSRLKRILFSLTGVADLDLRSVQRRLDRIWGRDRDSLGITQAVVSGVMSAEGNPEQPDDYLMDLVPQLIHLCRDMSLPLLAERGAPALAHLWPGEHYRLLAALVRKLRPKTIVEIGTFSGLSALAMIPEMDKAAKLVTFDVVPWEQIDGTYLKESDLADGRFTQQIDNLIDDSALEKHRELLRQADLILVDGPKDGEFEPRLFAQFDKIGLKHGTLVVLDDMRFFCLLSLWRNITRPRLDFTGFGHWSGTGLIHWI